MCYNTLQFEVILLNIADVNINDLPERLAHQVYPFWQAYHRPYPPALTWRQLRAEGLEPKEWTTCGIAEIEESFDEIVQYTLDDDGCITALKGDERASWLERRINAWSRKDIWQLEPSEP